MHVRLALDVYRKKSPVKIWIFASFIARCVRTLRGKKWREKLSTFQLFHSHSLEFVCCFWDG